MRVVIKKSKRKNIFPFILVVFLLAVSGVTFLLANSSMMLDGRSRASEALISYVIYDNALAAGWQNWSFSATADFATIESGTNSVINVVTKRGGGLYLHTDNPLNLPNSAYLEFDVNSRTSSVKYSVRLQQSNDKQIGRKVNLSNVGGNPQLNTWKHYRIPFTAFTSTSVVNVGGVIIESETSKSTQIYVDNIKFQVFDNTVNITPIPTTPLPQPQLPTSTPTTPPSPLPTSITNPSSYPLHTNITSTTFWVGEPIGGGSTEDNSISAYDDEWAAHYGCNENGNYMERRTAANNFFPPGCTPLENPFYMDLPLDDINNSTMYQTRTDFIPWATKPNPGQSYSFMKNRWVRLEHVSTREGSPLKDQKLVCYAQIEDAGPYVYNDRNYVFSTTDARPASTRANNAGMDVSPAVRDCLDFTDINGQSDKVNWQFVNDADVPNGPWKIVVTTRQVYQP